MMLLAFPPSVKNGTHRDMPAWSLCACGHDWCRIHDKHVDECDCPPIEEWTVNPYLEGGP